MEHPKYSEDSFMASLVSNCSHLEIYLNNGTKLDGQLIGLDKRCVFLRPTKVEFGPVQLIYTRLISTVKEMGRRRGDIQNDASFSEAVYLQSLVDDFVPASIFMCNGVKIKGQISGFDERSVYLSSVNSRQLIYKRSISTIQGASGQYQTSTERQDGA
jgi:RNA chaperone Hfq